MKKFRMIVSLGFAILTVALFGWHCSPVTINTENFNGDSGEATPDGNRTPGSCKSDDSCEPWEACRKGTCVHTCSEDLDCFEGHRCSREGICVETLADGGHGDADIPEGVGTECKSGTKELCYSGPAGTKNEGICKPGTKTCINGYWSKCEGELKPAKEICDALDNDCDGKIDEGCQKCEPKDLQKLEPGHTNNITGVAYDPAGKYYATASSDQTIKVWATATNALVHDFTIKNNQTNRMAFLPSGKALIALMSNRRIIRWNMETGKEEASAHLDQTNSQHLHISSDGKWLLTSPYGNRISRWSATDFKLIEEIPTTQQVRHLALSPVEDKIALSQSGKEVQIYDVKTKKSVKAGKASSLRAMTFSHDGKEVIAIDYSYLYRWDAKSGKELAKHKLARYAIAVFAHPDGKHAVVPGYNGEIYTYDLVTGKQAGFWRTPDRNISSVALFKDGSKVLYGTRQGKVQIAETKSGTLKHTINPITYVETNAVAYHPKGDFFAIVSQRTTIQVWDSKSLEVKHTFKTAVEVKALIFSPDGKTLYAGLFQDKKTIIRAWDWAGEKELFDEKKELGLIHTIAIAPDGKHLYTASEGNTIDEWDASTGKHLRSLRGHTGPVYSIAVTPDSKGLLTASWDNNIKRWDLASGDPVEGFTGHNTELNAIAITPDGSKFASGDSKGTIILWDLKTSKQLHTLRGHYGGVTSLQFSQDGARLLSSSLDGTLRLWSASTGQPIVAISAHKNGALAATFAPNGKDLLSGGGTGTRLWKCP